MHGALRWATLLVTVALVAMGAMAACGGSSLKQSGESCNASSECDRGLVCDFGIEPHVCSAMLTQSDAAPPDEDADVDDGGIDARPIDARVIDAVVIDAVVIDAVVIDAPVIDAVVIDAP